MSTQFSVSVVPGYQWKDGEIWTADKANLAAQPTVNVFGSLTGGVLGPGSITISNLTAGMFTADATGRAPFANGWLTLALIGNGIFTADATGRAPFAEGWLTYDLVASGTFIATTAGRAPFAAGWLTASMVQPDAYFYGGSTSGSSSTYVVAFTPALSSYTTPTISAYWDGLTVVAKIHVANAESPTLSCLTVGGTQQYRTVYRQDGSKLYAGDLVAGSIYEFRFNSSLNSGSGGWQLMQPVSPPNWRAGTVATTNATAVTVTFTNALPTGSYVVMVTQTDTVDASIQPRVSGVTNTGFTIKYNATTAHTWAYLVMPLAA